MKKIAIIGSGISGTASAYYLNKLGYDISVFEAGKYFGGHTNTIDIELEGRTIPVDTGFLVHNDRTYPNLIKFFKELSIDTHESDMTFSVERKSDNLVWSGTNLFTVFAQIKNLFSIRFLKFLGEVLRFNRNSKSYLDISKGNLDLTLGELLDSYNYSNDFRKWYLLPMGGCIWSTPMKKMLKFPASAFLIFCMNHGLLQIFNRPQWKTVLNGCRTYVQKALASIDKKYLNEPVESITSTNDKVVIRTKEQNQEFDYCVIATHPPETLGMLTEIDLSAKEFLKIFEYQPNEAVLHLDEKVLTIKKTAWAAWNYLSTEDTSEGEAVSVTYLINMLQPLKVKSSVLVTLNPVTSIDEGKVIKRINYQHPVFNSEAIKAQGQVQQRQGEKGVYFAGAWLRYGFHEDGIVSAKLVVKKILDDDKEASKTLEVL